MRRYRLFVSLYGQYTHTLNMTNYCNDAEKAAELRRVRERATERMREYRRNKNGKEPQQERRAARSVAFTARAAAATAAVDADEAAARVPQWAREMEGGTAFDAAMEQAAVHEADAKYWDWVGLKGMKRKLRKLYFKVEWDDRDGGDEEWVRQDRMGAMARVWDWLAINILDNRGIVSPSWNQWRATIQREWMKTRSASE